MKRLTDKQLVAVAGIPYSVCELDTLRLIEKMCTILEINTTQEDLVEFIELINNGWSDALVNIMYQNIEPGNLNSLICEYEERLKNYNIRC